MSNFKFLRGKINDAVRNGDEDVTLTIQEARYVIADAEQMAGGNSDGQAVRDQISGLQRQIERLKRNVSSIDKVGALLPGGES